MHQHQPSSSTPPGPQSAEAKLSALKTYRRALGLCYKCGAKWSKGHHCSPEVLQAVDALWDSFSSDDYLADSEPDSTPTEQLMLALSKSALSGIPAARTIRLVGSLANIPVQILVDSGSSSSFVNQSLVPRLTHIHYDQVSSNVQVAGGSLLVSQGVLRSVPWTVDGCMFTSDFRILPLANFDVVIGMDWLEAYSPMQVDWRQKWLAVPYAGAVHVLQGLAPSSPQHVSLHIDSLLTVDSDDTLKPEVPQVVQPLLQEFQDLFQPPTSLLPSRACDHEIPLIPGAQPVFIRPYRYPPKLKDEIDRQVQEMLSQGLIQPSTSAYSSQYYSLRRKMATTASVLTSTTLMRSRRSPNFLSLCLISSWMSSTVHTGFQL